MVRNCDQLAVYCQLVQKTPIFTEILSLRIQVCPIGKGLPLHSYSKDGVAALNPFLGKVLDP